MSDFRFGLDDYRLNYYPKDAVDDMGDVDWKKVESVEIDWQTFVREEMLTNRIAELEQRIEQLESLVRDMHALSKAPTPYMPVEVVAYMDMAESIDQRMAALGLMEGDKE